MFRGRREIVIFFNCEPNSNFSSALKEDKYQRREEKRREEKRREEKRNAKTCGTTKTLSIGVDDVGGDDGDDGDGDEGGDDGDGDDGGDEGGDDDSTVAFPKSFSTVIFSARSFFSFPILV